MSPTPPATAANQPDPVGRFLGGHRRRVVLRVLQALGVLAIWSGIAGVGGPAIGSRSSVRTDDASFLPCRSRVGGRHGRSQDIQ